MDILKQENVWKRATQTVQMLKNIPNEKSHVSQCKRKTSNGNMTKAIKYGMAQEKKMRGTVFGHSFWPL